MQLPDLLREEGVGESVSDGAADQHEGVAEDVSVLPGATSVRVGPVPCVRADASQPVDGVVVSMSSAKDAKQFARRLRKLGLRVELTRGSLHYQVSRDGRRVTTFPSSPSDHRSLLNARAALRRGGVDGI